MNKTLSHARKEYDIRRQEILRQVRATRDRRAAHIASESKKKKDHQRTKLLKDEIRKEQLVRIPLELRYKFLKRPKGMLKDNTLKDDAIELTFQEHQKAIMQDNQDWIENG